MVAGVLVVVAALLAAMVAGMQQEGRETGGMDVTAETHAALLVAG